MRFAPQTSPFNTRLWKDDAGTGKLTSAAVLICAGIGQTGQDRGAQVFLDLLWGLGSINDHPSVWFGGDQFVISSPYPLVEC